MAKDSAKKGGASNKHLFGSGNNTDFIVNLTPEKTNKLSGVYSIIAMLLIAVSTIPYYIAKATLTTNEYMILSTEKDDTVLFIISTMLMISGFFGLIFFMISCMKNEVMLKRNASMLLFLGIAISSAISAFSSADVNSALYGYLDRSEGLFAILCYIGFFLIGICLVEEKWRSRAVGTLIGIGTGNAVFAILQSIPALKNVIPSYYNFLFLGFKSNFMGSKSNVHFAEYFSAYGAYDASYAGEGLTCSPFALGALLTITAAFAVNKAAYTDKKGVKILCLVCTGIMSGAAVISQTLPAMLGVGCVLIVSLIAALVNKTKGAALSSALSLVAAVVITVCVCVTGNFRMSNMRIVFTDSFERLGIAYDMHSSFDPTVTAEEQILSNTANEYSSLWYDGTLALSEKPFIGVGPDNWSTMYNHGEGMETDRSYNEILDTAITRGILGAALYILLLVITVIKAARAMSFSLKNGGNKAVAIGAFTAIICFMIQAFFNTTSICSTPFFYLTVGIIWSYEAKGKLSRQAK